MVNVDLNATIMKRTDFVNAENSLKLRLLGVINNQWNSFVLTTKTSIYLNVGELIKRGRKNTLL